MTPARHAYFDKCSDKELKLRNLIAGSKYYLKTCKEDLTHFPEWGFLKGKVKQEKINLTALRHELAKFKGMENVTRARVVIYNKEKKIGYGRCRCGAHLILSQVICSRCGKRILWEKVE